MKRTLLKLSFLGLGLAGVYGTSCKSANHVSTAEDKGMQVAKSDGEHDLYVWLASKEFQGETNICVFFNQGLDTTSNNSRSNSLETAIFESPSTIAWNRNYITWTNFRRALIATAQKIRRSLDNGTNTISYTAYFADHSTGEKTIRVDANKYAEFVSWFMTDLNGRAPDKVDRKSLEIFNYMYAVMDNISDADQVSPNQCGKSANKDLTQNASVDDDARMDLYKSVVGQLKPYLTGGWQTGAAFWRWTGPTVASGPSNVPSGGVDCPSSDPWNCYFNIKKADKPAALQDTIRGVGKSTAQAMVENNAFSSKPRDWDAFKAEIKRLSQSDSRLGDLYNNVVSRYGSDNKKHFYP